MATFGKSPYPDVDRTEVLPKLESGYRMPKPEKCLPGMYTIMRSCWEFNVKDRPTFAQLHERLNRLQEHPDWDGVVGEEVVADDPGAASEPAPVTSAAAPTAADAAPPPLPARNAAQEQPPSLPPRNAAPEPEPEPEGDAAPATDWRAAYKNEDVDLENVSQCVDLTKDVFGKSQRILRYGDEETLSDMLKDLKTAVADLEEGLKSISDPAVKAAAKVCDALVLLF